MSPIGPAQPEFQRRSDAPDKVRDAAEQFEALLLGQILRAAREGGEASSDCAMDYAEQQFAAVMARNGGLGLASLVVKGLEPQN
jgi:Rod binding domain-containing protein